MFAQTRYETTKTSFMPKNAEVTHTSYANKMADVMYHINGSGRDTYIYNDNGGFADMHRARNQNKPGRFLPRVSVSPVKHANVVEKARPKHYITDGSGRDSYIVRGDGGFMNPTQQYAMDPRMIFARNLRGYERDGDYLARRANRQRYSKISPQNSPHRALNVTDGNVQMHNTQTWTKDSTKSIEPQSSTVRRFAKEIVRNHIASDSRNVKQITSQKAPSNDMYQTSYQSSFSGTERKPFFSHQRKASQYDAQHRTQQGRLEPLQPVMKSSNFRDPRQSDLIGTNASLETLTREEMHRFQDQIRKRMSTIQTSGKQTVNTSFNAEKPLLEMQACDKRQEKLQRKGQQQTMMKRNNAKLHPNSIDRSGISVKQKQAPKMPNYNPTMHDASKVAVYLRSLDTRLSQPKLHSPLRTSQQSMGMTQTRIENTKEHINALQKMRMSPTQEQLTSGQYPVADEGEKRRSSPKMFIQRNQSIDRFAQPIKKPLNVKGNSARASFTLIRGSKEPASPLLDTSNTQGELVTLAQTASQEYLNDESIDQSPTKITNTLRQSNGSGGPYRGYSILDQDFGQ